MFLRKLFKSDSKLKWVFIDLIIVIIGVYSAFLIQSYAVTQANNKEREKVYSALKYELEFFRFMGPQIANYMENEYAKFDTIRKAGDFPNFSQWIYIQPQYTYQIIEYAINLPGNEVIDFQMQQHLQDLFVEIKRLEYTENKIEEFSNKYRSMPIGIDSNSIEAKLLSQENRDNFNWFLRYFQVRGGVLAQTGEVAAEALPLINSRMDPKVRKKIEEEMIKKQVAFFPSIDSVISVIIEQFPDFSEAEIRKIHEESRNIEKE